MKKNEFKNFTKLFLKQHKLTELFEKNLRYQRRVTLDKWLDYKYNAEDLIYVISTAFSFRLTDQGFNFWNGIDRKFVSAYDAEVKRLAWNNFLNKYYCKADPVTGNRPCDNGLACDKCHTTEAAEEFENYLHKDAVGLSRIE